MRKLDVFYSHNSDNWETPKSLMRCFAYYRDRAPFMSDVDELSREWSFEPTYINPPFSKVSLFADKACSYIWPCDCWFLVPVRSDTKWFHKLAARASCIVFLEGRLHFSESKNAAPFPCCLINLRHSFFNVRQIEFCSLDEFIRRFNHGDYAYD